MQTILLLAYCCITTDTVFKFSVFTCLVTLILQIALIDEKTKKTTDTGISFGTI